MPAGFDATTGTLGGPLDDDAGDEGWDMTDGGDITPRELRIWLKGIEQRVDRLDGKISNLDSDVRDRLDRIDRVSYREWADTRKADREYAEETRNIANHARAAAWACFSLLAMIVLGSGFALIRGA